ncbi:hypothetical protein E4U22_004114 [Claviceps purpurea]|nr:hypothetical protein E4U22_004114 [Claviceps purpurea]
MSQLNGTDGPATDASFEVLDTDTTMRKMPQKKSHSIFTPVEEGRSSKKVAPRRKSLLEESRSSKKVAPRRKSLLEESRSILWAIIRSQYLASFTPEALDKRSNMSTRLEVSRWRRDFLNFLHVPLTRIASKSQAEEQ